MKAAHLALLFAAQAVSLSAATEVPLWRPSDISFRSSTVHDNPFEVAFSATVTAPDGAAFETLGFFDGEETWKVRLSMNQEGEWKVATHSSDSELDGKSETVFCTGESAPALHGGLHLDSEHPYHFVYEDGTRYFLNGYECDWLWALDAEDPSLPTLNPFLDLLAQYGFNQVILNTYAHDTSWRTGKTGPDDFGPPPRFAWEGTNEDPDHSRMNLAFWQHYDRMMGALVDRGIVAHILIKVYNKKVKWPKRGSAEDDLFFKWVVARYAAFPNVVWDFSKEAHNEKDLDYKVSRFRLLRETDPYRRLITNHDDNEGYESGRYDDLLDFRTDQCHKDWGKTIRAQRKQNEWPVVNVEFGYEHGPGGMEDKTYGVVQSPEEVARRGWEVCLAGGYPAYYYTNTAWDVIRPTEVPVGYSYFKRLRDFFETTEYWLMAPDDGHVSEGRCLANRGQEYIVFEDLARRFAFDPRSEGASFEATWFHPFTGEWRPAGEIGSGTNEVAVPEEWGAIPAVLHVKKKSE